MKSGKYVIVEKVELLEIYAAADRIEKAFEVLAYNKPDDDEKCKELAMVSTKAIDIMGWVESLL